MCNRPSHATFILCSLSGSRAHGGDAPANDAATALCIASSLSSIFRIRDGFAFATAAAPRPSAWPIFVVAFAPLYAASRCIGLGRVPLATAAFFAIAMPVAAEDDEKAAALLLRLALVPAALLFACAAQGLLDRVSDSPLTLAPFSVSGSAALDRIGAGGCL